MILACSTVPEYHEKDDANAPPEEGRADLAKEGHVLRPPRVLLLTSGVSIVLPTNFSPSDP